MSSESRNQSNTRQEALTIARYLGLPQDDKWHERLTTRYGDFHRKSGFELTQAEQRTWDRLMRFPFLIPLVDTALSFGNPYSVIRRKIHLVIVIAESDPFCSGFFLNPPRGRSYLLLIPIIGLRGVFNLISGKILLALWR